MPTTEQPKKPLSGYFLWLNDNRAKLQKELGNAKGSEVSKLGGERWKVVSAKDKEVYEQKAKDLKEQYEKDMATFKDQGGVVAGRKRKGEGKVKKEKDPNAPKRPAGGAYGVWMAANRPTIVKSLPAGHKITDVAKKGGELWKVLSDAEKAPFQAEFEEKMKAYKKAMEEFKAAGGAAEDEEDAEDGDEGEEEKQDEEEPAEPPAKKARAAPKRKSGKQAAPGGG